MTTMGWLPRNEIQQSYIHYVYQTKWTLVSDLELWFHAWLMSVFVSQKRLLWTQFTFLSPPYRTDFPELGLVCQMNAIFEILHDLLAVV
jgi:hypothetical protein